MKGNHTSSVHTSMPRIMHITDLGYLIFLLFLANSSILSHYTGLSDQLNLQGAQLLIIINFHVRYFTYNNLNSYNSAYYYMSDRLGSVDK